MRLITIAILAISILIITGVLIIYTKFTQTNIHQTTLSRDELPLPEWAISFGNRNASVVLIELFDLHCPACAYAHNQLDPLYRELIREGKIRIIFLDLIVHREAVLAHRLLHCAYSKLGEETYELITQLYRVDKTKQIELLKRYMCDNAPSEEDFKKAAEDIISYLRSRGVRQIGTPTFIIIRNGNVNIVVGANVAEVKSLISQ
ncbi:MAG: thioredoxin domain-containing protein [Pyrobaculum sp.]|jgi:protein-disulfide isomerase